METLCTYLSTFQDKSTRDTYPVGDTSGQGLTGRLVTVEIGGGNGAKKARSAPISCEF